ncbi:heavy-metal-associated domain-containing protein [Actinosynnema sp. CA-299493]|uniref:Copper chaperone CopZ n=1 Tax=Saccharothrix texasensis TaxID=103734 RepID=A0A3N1H414_9PSEU|nr:heavy-metal-associated domain-containing protein [Saccharothrix texasensis]ROP37259.1 copper chaperone CopZ [Saccharothrix texasensis]
MSTISINVEGMTCNSCVNKVTDAVSAVDGVEDVDVDVASGEVTVSGSQVDPEIVRTAVTEAGYRIAS